MKKSSYWTNRLILSLAAVTLVGLLVGCSSVLTTLGLQEPALKGVFMDSAVGGIGYATPTYKGVTKADGVFEYKAGETVTFFVGELQLGSTTGKPVVTPLDLVPDAKDVTDQRVTNICVLLQTLDQDADPTNGIMITKKTAAAVTQYGKEINFNKPVRAFSFDAGFRSVLTELNNVDAFGESPRAVKPPFTAQKHFKATLEGLKK